MTNVTPQVHRFIVQGSMYYIEVELLMKIRNISLVLSYDVQITMGTDVSG